MTQPQPRLSARPSRPPVVLQVVGGVAADEYLAPVDWSAWYLTDEEDMGQSPEQTQVIRLLEPALRRWCETRGWSEAWVGADHFFGWMEQEPNVRVSPDLYVLAQGPPGPLPRSFQTWRPGHEAPRIAFEIVSTEWTKDYRVAPQKYAALGVEELVIFDPTARSSERRVELQVYRRTEDGLFVSAYNGTGPAWSEVLGVWLVVVETPLGLRLRLSEDRLGTQLVLTDEETLAERDTALAAERDARLAAEQELARLRAELERRG